MERGSRRPALPARPDPRKPARALERLLLRGARPARARCAALVLPPRPRAAAAHISRRVLDARPHRLLRRPALSRADHAAASAPGGDRLVRRARPIEGALS